MFYFAGYQGTRTRQTPPDLIAFVPTPAMLAGDFTTFASPACQGRQVTLGAGFVDNRIDPARFSPAALKMAGFLPKTTDPCGQITYSQPDDRDEGQYVGRVDYQLERQPLGVRPLHGVARQEAVGVRHDGQRADDGESVDRQPGAVAHARRYEGLRQQHGQRAAVCVQPHRRQSRQRPLLRSARLSASRPPPTCRAR